MKSPRLLDYLKEIEEKSYHLFLSRSLNGRLVQSSRAGCWWLQESKRKVQEGKVEVKQNLVRIIWSSLEISFPRVNFGGSGLSSGEVSPLSCL